MKLVAYLIPFLFIIASSASGGQLQQDVVSSEAKWLLHLDAQRFKDSQVGQYVMEEFVEKNLPEVGPFNLNLQEIVKLVDGITLYGNSLDVEKFEENFDGIAVIQAHPDLRAMLEAVMFMAEQQEGKAPFTVLQEEPYKLVDIDGQISAAFFGDDMIVIGKKQSAIAEFSELQEGNRPDLSRHKTFQSIFSMGDGTVTVLAAAEGFQQLANLPQAQILKMANGILLSLDEKADQLTLNATLTTVDEGTANQVRQVLQGILAMAALANLDELQFSQLLRSAHTEANGTNVNLGMSFPIADLFTLLDTFKPVIIEGTDATGGDRLEVGSLKSSVDQRHLPMNVLDGNPETYWTSAGKEKWIELRFAAPAKIETLELMWHKGNERQQSFVVEALSKGGSWYILYEGNSGADLRNLKDLDYEFIPIEVTTTESIRITGNGNTVNHWNSLSEVRVNGGQIKPYSAVSIADAKTLPANLFDTNKDTVWDTMGRDVWLEGSVIEESTIQEIGIVWSTDGTSSVHLEVSSDSLDWQSVLSVKGPVKAGELQKYNVVDTKAKFFRISPMKDGDWEVPAEIVLYGVSVNGQ